MTDRDADIVRDGLAIGKRAVATGVLAGCRADWFDRPNAALDRLVAERDAAIEAAFTCVGHAEEVEAERDRLREALAFYANESNYNAVSLMLRRAPEDEHPPVAVDRGTIARGALGRHQ